MNSSEFDKLNRQVSKLQDGGKTPKPYIRIIAELEDSMNEALAKQKVTPKKMNATQAKALNAVKQKIKKTNKDYQTQIDAYREDNDAFMESEEEEEPAPAPKKKAAVKFDEPAPGEEIDPGEFITMGKGGKAKVYTPESIFKHLRGIMETRGKKNTDRAEQIGVMETLNEIANTPYQQIRVLLAIVSARFDVSSSTSNTMPLEHWKAAEKELSTLLTVLHKNPDYVVVENAEEWDDDEKPPSLQPGEKYIKVPGSLVSYVERLDDELVRSLQAIDPHTSEYIERLQDEGALYNIIFRGLLYYENLRKDESLQIPQESINRIVMRRLEHVYFKVSFCPYVHNHHHTDKDYSPLRSSRPSRTTAGRRSARTPSPSSPPATNPRTPAPSSTSCATTSSATARASSAPAPCCARSTSSPCTATTTRPAT